MADKSEKYPDNIGGKYYVDKTCIACDACCTTAPGNFKMTDDGHAVLSKQPLTPEEEDLCRQSMEGCPVEAIGNDGEK